MNDSRLERARDLLVRAIKTADATYFRVLIEDARTELADVLED